MFKIIKHIHLLFLTSLFCFTVSGQTTVDIPCTGNINPNSGYVAGSGSTGNTKYYGYLMFGNSGEFRAWARFDIQNYIPSNATIISASAIVKTETVPSSNTPNNFLRFFTGNPSTMTADGIWDAIGNTAQHESNNNDLGTTNGVKSRGINATGVTFLNSNKTVPVNLGFSRGTGNNRYRLYGSDGARNGSGSPVVNDRPILRITYTVPCTPPPAPPQVAANITVGPVRDGNPAGLGSPLLPNSSLPGGDGTHHTWWGRLFNPLNAGAIYTPAHSCWLETYNYGGNPSTAWKADLGAIKNVNGVILQGRPYSEICSSPGQFTSVVNVKVSSDNVTWTDMGNFNANTETHKIETIIFPNKIPGRYVAIIPISGGVFRADVISIPCGSGSHSVSVSAELPLGATNIKWYDAPTGGTLLGTSMFLTRTISQNTTFYAAAYNGNGGCESTTRTAVTAIVGGNPALPNITSTPNKPTCGAPVKLSVGITDMIPEPRAGLVAHYPFNGNLNDVSGRGLHLSGTGNFNNGGLNLSGASHASAITNILDTDNHTIAFYIKYITPFDGTWSNTIFGYAPPGSSRSPTIWRMHTANQHHWQYQNSAGSNTGYGDNLHTYQLEKWHHVVGVKKGGSFSLYVDGVLLGTGSVSNPKFPGSAVLQFGSSQGTILRDFKIFNRSISSAEVGDLAQWKWYSAECEGTLVGVGPEITVNPTVTTEYFVNAKNACTKTPCVGYTFAGSPAYTAGNISVGPKMSSAANLQLGGIEPPLIPDAAISASHELVGHESWRGRLFNQYWYAPSYGGAGDQATTWASGNPGVDNYIQIDLGENRSIKGVISQSRGYDWYPTTLTSAGEIVKPYEQRILNYTVQYSADGIVWDDIDNGITFSANSLFNQDPVTNTFQQIANGRYVRIHIPAGSHVNHMSARVDVISYPCSDVGPYNIHASASLPKDIHGRQGAYTIKWYTAASGGAAVGTGQRITRSLAANSTQTLYAATYYSDGSYTCETTTRTPVTISSSVPFPAGQATVPTKDTDFSNASSTGWRLGNSVTNTRTLDCSGRSAVLNQLGDYMWIRTNAPANFLDYTIKVIGTGKLLVQQSTDGCSWTTIASHTNNPTAITRFKEVVLLNSSKHFRFHVVGSGATFEIDNVQLYNTQPNSALSIDGEQATCEVYGNHWVDFYGTSGRLLGAVNAQGKDLGNVQMNSHVGALGTPFVMHDCSAPTNPSYHTAYMGRRWVMNSTAFPTGNPIGSNILVRLPYNNTELAALNQTAQNTTTGNPHDDGATITNLMLTKITGATENGIANSADCASTIRAIPTNSGSGTNIQSIANTQYLDFTITEFSEFFLHKNYNNSPLPVTLTNFSATCDKEVTLNWTTASEQNSDRFVVEKSRDLEEWTFVAEQAAAGNSNTTINYVQFDENTWNGVAYYRLKQIDLNGDVKIYGPISVSCAGNENNMTVYPNPNNGLFTVEISSDEIHADAQLILTDVTGKIIYSQKVNVEIGTTQILLNNLEIEVGTYLVSLRTSDSGMKQLRPVKVMVKQ